ncbi:MAG: DUF411 domain-containing protein [Gemmatimonadales bacterium]
MVHLRNNGFEVDAVNVSEAELMSVKTRYGVANELASCHTALVDGYVVEGHVPAEDVVRMLRERPEIVGLTVPGMPAGSPGMEVPSGEKERYDVLAFDEAGNTSVFARH